MIASVASRVQVRRFDEKAESKKPKEGGGFLFGAHRHEFASSSSHGAGMGMYSVNEMGFNPRTKALATVASDGSYELWDIFRQDSIHKSKPWPLTSQRSISSMSWSSDGNLFAYALSYDYAAV